MTPTPINQMYSAKEIADVLELLKNNYQNKIFDIRSVVLSIGERNPPLTDEQRARIKQRWNEALEKNPKSFSKPLLGVSRVVHDPKTRELTIDAYVSSYKDYSRTIQDESDADRIWCIGACGLTYVVENGLSHFVFGERSKKTLNVGGAYESLPGGFSTPHPDCANPITATLLDELEEETGVSRSAVADISYLSSGQLREWDGIKYQDGCLNHLVRLAENLRSDDVVRAFDKGNVSRLAKGQGIEHTQIMMVPESALLQFIRENHQRFGVRTLFTLESYLR